MIHSNFDLFNLLNTWMEVDMRKEINDMLDEGWQIECVHRDGFAKNRLEVSFSHSNLNKFPTPGWIYDKNKFTFSMGRLHVHAVLWPFFCSSEEKSDLLELNKVSIKRSRSERHINRSKFNKDLAKANLENQIRRNTVTMAGNLGSYIPFYPKIVK